MRNRKSVDWILGESRSNLKMQERTIRALTAGEASGIWEARLLIAATATHESSAREIAGIFCRLLTFKAISQSAHPFAAGNHF